MTTPKEHRENWVRLGTLALRLESLVTEADALALDDGGIARVTARDALDALRGAVALLKGAVRERATRETGRHLEVASPVEPLKE
jgi:hypothetical protein